MTSSTDQIVLILIARFTAIGWEVDSDSRTDSEAIFSNLFPAPDAVLTLRAARAALKSHVAVHLADGDGGISYACTMYFARREVAQERGRIDPLTSAIEVVDVRGNFAADRSLMLADAPIAGLGARSP